MTEPDYTAAYSDRENAENCADEHRQMDNVRKVLVVTRKVRAFGFVHTVYVVAVWFA